MAPGALVEGRKARGWTQVQASKFLGISQSYLSMLETGERIPTPALARRAARLYRLPPTALALPPELDESPADVAGELAALGYAGFPYASKRGRRNPAEVLVAALAQDELDARVAEALPWVLLQFPDMDWDWVVRQAKIHNLQNRLGYLVHLAREVAECGERYRGGAPELARREAALDASRLAREGTLCRESMTPPERKWLRRARPAGASHWNLLTSLTREQLRYAG